MTEHAVVIAGGGPTGLMLAGELSLAGVDVVIVEPRPTQELDGSRAGGLHSRTLEVLDQRGVSDRFVAEGQTHPAVGYSLISMDISDFPTRHNYVLSLWQGHIERILLDWINELGVPILRSRSVTHFTSSDSHTDVELSNGSSLRAQYLVGCDGGRSLVRKTAGIEFPGLAASTSWMVAEVELDDQPEFGIRRDSVGQHAIGRRLPGEPVRLVLTERSAEHTSDPTIDELRAALVGVYGKDFGIQTANWISRFTDTARQVAANDRHDVRPRATPSRFAYRSMEGATVCARAWQWRRESTTLAGTRTTPCKTGRKDGSAFSPKSRWVLDPDVTRGKRAGR